VIHHYLYRGNGHLGPILAAIAGGVRIVGIGAVRRMPKTRAAGLKLPPLVQANDSGNYYWRGRRAGFG
jgi:hypothetical protein